MSRLYTTVENDSYEIIARKQYGDENQANIIARSNPGVKEPFTVGLSIVIPELSSTPVNNQQQAVAVNQDEIAILIDGVRFRFWDSIAIRSSIDAMTVVEFGAPFDSSNKEMRRIFKPFTYKKVVVTIGGNPVFTGTMVTIDPILENSRRVLSVTCYSIPGVLNDCTAPASSFPLEFNEQGLRDITIDLCSSFGISVSFKADQGAVFERVALDSNKKVLSFLIELAKQRSLLISDTSRGKLLFHKPIMNGKPVARLRQGESPVISITPLFKPQEYYSSITGIEAEELGFPASQFTVKNPHLKNVIRPFTFDIDDTTSADVKNAVEAKMGRMLANAASYSVQLDTWRDFQGNLWEPNTIVTLHAHDVMIYKEYKFIIRSISFNKDSDTKEATLQLAIPGTFNGEIPKVLPWEG